MRNERVVAAALIVIAGAVGCSSGTEAIDPDPGQLSPGTAQITINGKAAGTSEAVQCLPSKHLTMITIGDESPVAVAMISNADGLAVESVKILDLTGFNGSYNDGLGGEARVTITGSTYQISGVAGGFNKRNPSRPTTEEFTIEVAC